ncbi:MAG: hypothetical protein CMH78_01455 [Nitrospinae bacterium]|nr:hypothetical protein [Nitrospinota bacterium]
MSYKAPPLGNLKHPNLQTTYIDSIKYSNVFFFFQDLAEILWEIREKKIIFSHKPLKKLSNSQLTTLFGQE